MLRTPCRDPAPQNTHVLAISPETPTPRARQGAAGDAPVRRVPPCLEQATTGAEPMGPRRPITGSQQPQTPPQPLRMGAELPATTRFTGRGCPELLSPPGSGRPPCRAQPLPCFASSNKAPGQALWGEVFQAWGAVLSRALRILPSPAFTGSLSPSSPSYRAPPHAAAASPLPERVSRHVPADTAALGCHGRRMKDARFCTGSERPVLGHDSVTLWECAQIGLAT